AKPDLHGDNRGPRRDGRDWRFGDDTVWRRARRARLRYRRRKQQAAQYQDANHRAPAPTMGWPRDFPFAAQAQVRRSVSARHAWRFPVNAIISTQTGPPSRIRHMGIVDGL